MVKWGSAEAPVPRNDVSFRTDQKTANFKAAIMRRPKQWSDLPEGKQKNELANAEFRFIKTIIIIRVSKGAAITSRLLSPLNQRCTAAKTGNFQVTGGLC
jgi:hypothetical protein